MSSEWAREGGSSRVAWGAHVALVLCLLSLSLSLFSSASASASTAVAEPLLKFVSPKMDPVSLPLATLRQHCSVDTVEVDDPYHERSVGYFALPLRCVLDQGFAAIGGSKALTGEGLVLRALDGYTRPASGADLLEPGGHIAFGEVALMESPEAKPRFTRIERANVDPAPFYMIWAGSGQNDPHFHPWPFQLDTIEVAAFSAAFPRTRPSGLEASDPGWSGYAIFQRSCVSCHSINGEGGKVGPDLNVPQSIVEYRPIPQIKAYIRNPQATRYTNMPSHPDLGDADLDALIAYFEAMRHRKQDLRAKGNE